MSSPPHSDFAPRRPRLLLVDDDRDVLNGLERLIQRLEPSWEIYTAAGGIQALARCDSESIDVVVTDLQMPGMDGSQLLLELFQSHPGTIRILHSSHPEILVERLPAPLAHHVVRKPASGSDLIRALRMAMDAALSSRRWADAQ